HYGRDYWDLAEFFINKGESEKAVEVAEEGLSKGEGRLTELFEFLTNHYAKNRDTANLERIVQHALKKKSDEKTMLDKLFIYYESQNDYEKAKKVLLQAFEYVKTAGYGQKASLYTHYNKMKQFLTGVDWKNIEPKIIAAIREKDLKGYLRICLDKGMKREVVDILLHPPKKQSMIGFWFETEYDFDEFASRLKEEFPEDIIKYYWQKAYSYIKNGNRKTYRIATEYLAKVKQIYIDILEEESQWKRRFTDIKAEFKKRPAFLQEVEEL
ncbi:MAG: tetratricopeptide repeat protein, partial [Candidatus Zixiibacteriota bacterium]